MPDSAPGERNRHLVVAGAILVASVALSRLSGLLRTIVVGAAFGTGAPVDAFLAANRVTDLLYQITAGGVVGAAFIPVLGGLLAGQDRERARRLVTTALTLSVILVVPIAVAAALLAEPIIATLTGFDREHRALAVELMRIQLVAPVVFALGTFATSTLNANGRFLFAGLAPSFYNLGIILGAVFLAPSLGVHGLAIGASVGAVLYLVVQTPDLMGTGLVGRPLVALRDVAVRSVGRLLVPRALGLAVAQINVLVVVVLASTHAGAMAALDYAWTLTMLPLGLFAMAVATAVFPTLTREWAGDATDEFSRILRGSLRVTQFLIVPSTVGLYVLAEPIVLALLGRGAFGDAAVSMTVGALRLYALGLGGLAAVEVLTRGYYALLDTRTPLAIAAVAALANVALALILRERLSFHGLALAVSLAATLEAGLLILLWRRLFPGARALIDLGHLGRCVLAAAAFGGPLSAFDSPVRWSMAAAGDLERVARVAALIVGAAVVYLAVGHLLGVKDGLSLLRRATRRVE